jgi:hypothetical protein
MPRATGVDTLRKQFLLAGDSFDLEAGVPAPVDSRPTSTKVYEALSRQFPTIERKDVDTAARYVSANVLGVASTLSTVVDAAVTGFLALRLTDEKTFDTHLGGITPFMESPNTVMLSFGLAIFALARPPFSRCFPRISGQSFLRKLSDFDRFIVSLSFSQYTYAVISAGVPDPSLKLGLGMLSAPAFIIFIFCLFGITVNRDTIKEYHESLNDYFSKPAARAAFAGIDAVADAAYSAAGYAGGAVSFISYWLDSQRTTNYPRTKMVALIFTVIAAMVTFIVKACAYWWPKSDAVQRADRLNKTITELGLQLFSWITWVETWMIYKNPGIETASTAQGSVNAFKNVRGTSDTFVGIGMFAAVCAAVVRQRLPALGEAPSFDSVCGYVRAVFGASVNLEAARKPFAELQRDLTERSMPLSLRSEATLVAGGDSLDYAADN